jgi:signal transduction histidine kinase/ActR/RegA family two-component response regulator
MAGTELSTKRLLAFARKLQRAATFEELVVAAGDEVKDTLGYEHAWFMVADDEAASELRMIDAASARRERMWEIAPRLRVKGDAFLEHLIAADEPVVIEDARVDPRTNKEVVAQLQNRSLINLPLRLVDKPFGIFGVGTFGDEGCRVPMPHELEFLVGMASQLAVAAGRIRFLESRAEAERAKLSYERRLLQVHKLESMGLLAGGIAHDFNNLLTVILASASLAELRAGDDAELSLDLRAVMNAATRARDLTRQLLAMSRTQDLELRPVDLHVQLGQLIDLLRRVLPETISIDYIPALNLPLIEGDSSQLDQVFMNLCINARDAMSSGGRLTIETEQVLINGKYTEAHPWAKAGRYVLVTFTDSGEGIAPDVLERVFEPFLTNKDGTIGSGLGLAVAYGIVRQHNGMLHCYSEVGVGTTFKIYMPVYERLASAVGTKLSLIPRGSERIMIAEDDTAVRNVVVRILTRGGYEVSAVESGDAACRLAAQQRFDLVVLDVVMPGMSCQQTVERLRVQLPNARILLSSGYSAGANITALQEQTGLSLLRKPYDPDQLLRAIREALDKGRE